MLLKNDRINRLYSFSFGELYFTPIIEIKVNFILLQLLPTKAILLSFKH